MKSGTESGPGGQGPGPESEPQPRSYKASSHASVESTAHSLRFQYFVDNELDSSEMCDEDLLHYSPTIPGWILSDKIWGKALGHRYECL